MCVKRGTILDKVQLGLALEGAAILAGEIKKSPCITCRLRSVARTMAYWLSAGMPPAMAGEKGRLPRSDTGEMVRVLARKVANHRPFLSASLRRQDAGAAGLSKKGQPYRLAFSFIAGYLTTT
jgi:hypothetical protein